MINYQCSFKLSLLKFRKSVISTIWLLRVQRKEHAYTEPIRKQHFYLQRILKYNVYYYFVPLLFERVIISCQSFLSFFDLLFRAFILCYNISQQSKVYLAVPVLSCFAIISNHSLMEAEPTWDF